MNIGEFQWNTPQFAAVLPAQRGGSFGVGVAPADVSIGPGSHVHPQFDAVRPRLVGGGFPTAVRADAFAIDARATEFTGNPAKEAVMKHPPSHAFTQTLRADMSGPSAAYDAPLYPNTDAVHPRTPRTIFDRAHMQPSPPPPPREQLHPNYASVEPHSPGAVLAKQRPAKKRRKKKLPPVKLEPTVSAPPSSSKAYTFGRTPRRGTGRKLDPLSTINPNYEVAKPRTLGARATPFARAGMRPKETSERGTDSDSSHELNPRHDALSQRRRAPKIGFSKAKRFAGSDDGDGSYTYSYTYSYTDESHAENYAPGRQHRRGISKHRGEDDVEEVKPPPQRVRGARIGPPSGPKAAAAKKPAKKDARATKADEDDSYTYTYSGSSSPLDPTMAVAKRVPGGKFGGAAARHVASKSRDRPRGHSDEESGSSEPDRDVKYAAVEKHTPGVTFLRGKPSKEKPVAKDRRGALEVNYELTEKKPPGPVFGAAPKKKTKVKEPRQTVLEPNFDVGRPAWPAFSVPAGPSGREQMEQVRGPEPFLSYTPQEEATKPVAPGFTFGVSATPQRPVQAKDRTRTRLPDADHWKVLLKHQPGVDFESAPPRAPASPPRDRRLPLETAAAQDAVRPAAPATGFGKAERAGLPAPVGAGHQVELRAPSYAAVDPATPGVRFDAYVSRDAAPLEKRDEDRRLFLDPNDEATRPAPHGGAFAAGPRTVPLTLDQEIAARHRPLDIVGVMDALRARAPGAIILPEGYVAPEVSDRLGPAAYTPATDYVLPRAPAAVVAPETVLGPKHTELLVTRAPPQPGPGTYSPTQTRHVAGPDFERAVGRPDASREADRRGPLDVAGALTAVKPSAPGFTFGQDERTQPVSDAPGVGTYEPLRAIVETRATSAVFRPPTPERAVLRPVSPPMTVLNPDDTATRRRPTAAIISKRSERPELLVPLEHQPTFDYHINDDALRKHFPVARFGSEATGRGAPIGEATQPGPGDYTISAADALLMPRGAVAVVGHAARWAADVPVDRSVAPTETETATVTDTYSTRFKRAPEPAFSESVRFRDRPYKEEAVTLADVLFRAESVPRDLPDNTGPGPALYHPRVDATHPSRIPITIPKAGMGEVEKDPSLYELLFKR